MKLKKAGIGLMCLTTTLTFALAGCGGSGTQVGDKEKGDRVEITFLASVNATSRDSWIELLEAYNDGVGYEEDGVYVTMKNGNGSPSSNYFTQSVDYACNVIAVNDSQNDNGLQALMITRDSRRAPDGLFVDLTPYAEADEDFKNNTISEQALNWGRMTYNPDAAQGAGAPKHVIGAGQNLMAVPYGVDPHFNWYNAALFKAQGINIISCPEEELPEEYPNVQPHGYAEYKNAPFDGATSSKTLDGRTVYKVFNDCIGMNWEEMRYLLKYFSKEWNPSSTSNYGFVSEYWFNYGWSVGGDVMGFNGTDYDFTLLDKSPNYLVTKDGTVINGNTYSRRARSSSMKTGSTRRIFLRWTACMPSNRSTMRSKSMSLCRSRETTQIPWISWTAWNIRATAWRIPIPALRITGSTRNRSPWCAASSNPSTTGFGRIRRQTSIFVPARPTANMWAAASIMTGKRRSTTNI